MNDAEQLVSKLTEGGEDFDARAYFRGTLSALKDKGFERVHQEEPYEQWMCETFMPFRIWAGRYANRDIIVSVEHDDRHERSVVHEWQYPMDALDAALAQVDRIIVLMRNAPGQTFHERHAYIWQTLQKMQEAPMVGEDDEELDVAGYLNYEEQLKQMGFEYVKSVGCYSKHYEIFKDTGRYVNLSLSLFYNTPHAFVDVYISTAEADPQAQRTSGYSLIKTLRGVPAEDVYNYVNRVARVASKLRAAGVNTASQVVKQCQQERLLETEQEFNPREYFLSDPVSDILKRLGYTKFSETSQAYTKLLFSHEAMPHYLTVYGGEYPGDPMMVVVEYQTHNSQLGYRFPWSAKVDYTRLTALLPVLESAVKSTAEQHMTLEQTKAVLDALVK